MIDLTIVRKYSSSKTPVVALVLIAILISSFMPSFGQSRIYIEHQHKTSRQKNISLKNEYIFHTAHTTFYNYRITSFSDSILSIRSTSKEGLIEIPINDIEQLEKARKNVVFEIIATIGIIGLTITPIIWATEGGESALGMLEASGFLLAVSVPFLVIKEIGRKKDTKNKWIIRVN